MVLVHDGEPFSGWPYYIYRVAWATVDHFWSGGVKHIIYVSVQESEQAAILLDPLAIGFSRAMVQLVIDEERLLYL